MTAEKEKAPVDDRVFIQQKTMQVLDELSRFDGFNDLQQKGLKTMTHKQFISILQHFLKPIAGNVQLDGTNYVDYIYHFIQTMEYPYTINKSSLKTPSAPHCQNSIIILLAWLSEFGGNNAEAPLIEYSATQDFETSEMAKDFVLKAEEAFAVWNNQQEAEAEEIMKLISDVFIQNNTGNCGSIDVDISKLKKSVIELRKEVKPITQQKSCNDKQEESKMLNERVQELTKITEELSHSISNLKNVLDSKQAEESKAEKELKALRKKITSQEMTNEERNKILIEICQAKQVLVDKKQAAMELTETNSENEIQLSKLIQKKFSLINKLNNSLYMVTSELEIAKVKTDFNPAAYEIKTTKISDASALDDEVEKLKAGLKILQDKFDSAMRGLDQDIHQLKMKLPGLLANKKSLRDEMTKIETKIVEVSAEEEKLTQNLAQRNQEQENVFEHYDGEIKQTVNDINKLKYNISKFEELNAQMLINKATFKTKSIEQISKFCEKRKKEVLENRERLNEMKRVIEDYNRKQKPFPDDVRKTIDEVMKNVEN